MQTIKVGSEAKRCDEVWVDAPDCHGGKMRLAIVSGDTCAAYVTPAQARAIAAALIAEADAADWK